MTVTVPFDDNLTYLVGVVNGGVIAALVDLASGAVLRSTYADPEEGFPATVEIDLEYLQPVTGDLGAEVETVHAGEAVGVTHATVTTPGQPQPGVIGSTVYRVFR